MRRNLWRSTVMRSGILTLLVLAVGLVLLALAWKQHQHGRFAQLKAELKKPVIIPASVVAQAGGQEPLVLERTHTEDATSPEFSKAILPPAGA